VSAENDSGWYSCAAVSESGSGITRAEVAVARDNDRPPPILQAGPVNQVRNKYFHFQIHCWNSKRHFKGKPDWLKLSNSTLGKNYF
jgi:hypothetical protein